MSQSVKSGRKSRRAHLPVSAVWEDERDFQFKTQDEDWGRIEGVYPFLTIEDREPIARLVAEYLRHDSFERYAPFLNDGLDWLARTGRAAKAFHRAITKLPEPPSPERLGALYAAQGLVERRIQHRALPNGLEWHTLQGILLHVIAALDAAKISLPRQAVGGFVEGQAWDVWVRELSDFAESRGYPTGASKGANKSKSDKPSHFVAFIRELQNTLPEECRRHTASDAALAWAIAEARSKRAGA